MRRQKRGRLRRSIQEPPENRAQEEDREQPGNVARSLHRTRAHSAPPRRTRLPKWAMILSSVQSRTEIGREAARRRNGRKWRFVKERREPSISTGSSVTNGGSRCKFQGCQAHSCASGPADLVDAGKAPIRFGCLRVAEAEGVTIGYWSGADSTSAIHP